jgi:hypothetical protein
MEQLIEALCHKPEGPVFESRWGLPNPSKRTMALGSTHLLTEMSSRNLPGGKRRPARKADNLTAICEAIISKMWKPWRLTILWAFTLCYRDNFTFFILHLWRQGWFRTLMAVYRSASIHTRQLLVSTV